MIFKESERVSDLGYEMQDVIAEMSYIDNFTECRIKINKIYNEMKKRTPGLGLGFSYIIL